MLFHNQWEIENNLRRHAGHPVLKRATRLLYNLMVLANGMSDGWCYWPKPSRAAKKLMELINSPETATEEAYKKACVPIKTFCTKHGKAFPSDVV